VTLFETMKRSLFGETPQRAARQPARPKGGRSTQPRPNRQPEPLSPERAALLAEAIRIHRAKRALLEDLADEDRFLLRIMAHQILGDGGDKPPDETTPANAPATPRTSPPPRDPGTRTDLKA